MEILIYLIIIKHTKYKIYDHINLIVLHKYNFKKLVYQNTLSECYL